VQSDLNQGLPHLQNEEEEKGGGTGSLLMRHLLKGRTIIIAKQVDRRLMEKVATLLFAMETDDPASDINVFVNSPGGDADSGFAIYDLLRFARPRVRTVCAGLAASAAVPIFLGGAKGCRFALPNARFLLHQPSMQMMGQASDLEITANEILKIRDRYNEIMAEETGQPRAKVEADANRDFWLTAKEAVQYGLVTRIVEKRTQID